MQAYTHTHTHTQSTYTLREIKQSIKKRYFVKFKSIYEFRVIFKIIILF